MEIVKNLGTHLLLIKVSQDYEEAEGHTVSFALGEEQTVWVATVAHILQEVNAASKSLFCLCTCSTRHFNVA
jgi:hypothetical protein